MRLRLPAALLLSIAISFAACGDSSDDGGAGGAGGLIEGAGGTAGSGGMGGTPGAGGSGGSSGGAGGSGGTGGSGEPACIPEDLQRPACLACIAGALSECGLAVECGTAFLELAACAEEAGCFTEEGIDALCAGIACQEESIAAAGCVAECPALIGCAGF